MPYTMLTSVPSQDNDLTFLTSFWRLARYSLNRFVPSGRIRVGMCDLRPASSTYKAVQTMEIGDANAVGIYIPIGVAHGFLALTDAILTYLVDNYYDGSDEHGVAWNDPDIGLDWGTASPRLSPRDAANPLLRDIPAENLPK